MHGGRRPKSLEGGNRGEVGAGGGVRLWGFSADVCCDFAISNGKDGRAGAVTAVLIAAGAIKRVMSRWMIWVLAVEGVDDCR